MVYYMVINEEKFQKCREGKRILILCLYDDLCRRIDLDDVIIISKNNDYHEKAAVHIVGLYRFHSFDELLANISAELLDEEQPKVSSRIKINMIKNYSETVEADFGVIGMLTEPFDINKAYELQKQIGKTCIKGCALTR